VRVVRGWDVESWEGIGVWRKKEMEAWYSWCGMVGLAMGCLAVYCK